MIATLALPRLRLNTVLFILTATLLAVYVALMITTIVFAALQTQLAQNVQGKHMEIAKLEAKYYESVAALDSTDPHALGYVTPQRVQYVTEASLPNLTFAR